MAISKTLKLLYYRIKFDISSLIRYSADYYIIQISENYIKSKVEQLISTDGKLIYCSMNSKNLK